MKKLKIYIACVIMPLIVAVSACHSLNKTQKGAAIGAGAGGTVGAFIGHAAGNTALGAVIGGALGGTAGAFIGHNMDSEANDVQKSVPNAKVVRQGEGIIVNFDSGLLFDVGKSELKPGAQTNLSNLSNSLQKYPQTNIIVIGHTDNTGQAAQNMDLSLQRAVSVRNYLASTGIDSAKLSTQGKGDTDPIADNSTPEGRAKNRRVELVILANDKMKNQAKQGGK
jgi:outer membrane protein OmpA-like peptidoglycan-associated protein